MLSQVTFCSSFHVYSVMLDLNMSKRKWGNKCWQWGQHRNFNLKLHVSLKYPPSTQLSPRRPNQRAKTPRDGLSCVPNDNGLRCQEMQLFASVAPLHLARFVLSSRNWWLLCNAVNNIGRIPLSQNQCKRVHNFSVIERVNSGDRIWRIMFCQACYPEHCFSPLSLF